MSEAGIEGTFCDIRLIAGRKVTKLIIEIPVEMTNAALERLGGYPNPVSPQWVMCVPFRRPDANS